jgi:stress response protein SCP2
MAEVMSKGANTRLAVRAVRAVLRWQDAPGTPDVDVSALLLGADGRVHSDADFVFYNQPRHPSGLVRHRAKQRCGEGLNEITDSLDVDLGRLPAAVQRVVIAASAESAAFGRVTALRLLLHDQRSAGLPGDEPLIRFDLTDALHETALLCGELYRRDGGWKFRAIGQGYESGLVGLATDFGIVVDADAEEGDGKPAEGLPGTDTPTQAGRAPSGGTPVIILPPQGPQFAPH